MNRLIKIRSVLSLSAASAVVSAVFFATPAMAAENDTYKTIHNGWLSEYQLQPGEALARTNRVFNAVSAENETYVTAHQGWLNAYRLRPAEVIVSTNTTYRAVSADNDAYATIHNGWLSEFETPESARMFAGTDEQGLLK